MQFIARMIRAAKLEPRLYEEVKTDKYATSQALVVVLLSSLAATIGAFTHAGLGGLVMGGLVALLAWYVWTFMTYIIGVKLFPVSQTSVSHQSYGVRLALPAPLGCSASLEPYQDLPGLRFSLQPCGCSLPRLLQYGRHVTIRARYVLLACVFLVG